MALIGVSAELWNFSPRRWREHEPECKNVMASRDFPVDVVKAAVSHGVRIQSCEISHTEDDVD